MKRWWKSKTLWLAGITGAMGIAQSMLDSGLLGQNAAGYTLIVVAVLSAVLRFVTTEPIK